MAPGQQAASWRAERCLYELSLPTSGWFVNISSSDSVGVLRALQAEWLTEPLAEDLTVSHLMGGNRHITTAVAAWVWKQVLDDESLPHGIRYMSKYGTDWRCTAFWLREFDDGKNPSGEMIQHVGGQSIDARDPDLRRAADLFGLRFH